MTNRRHFGHAVPASRRRASARFLALSLGIAGLIAVPVLADPSGRAPEPAPLRCEIVLAPVPGGTQITGRVHAPAPVSGDYDLSITSRSGGGQTTIRQSGAFEAAPGRPALLGETRLPGAPATQDVQLRVTVARRTLSCAAL